MKLTAVFLLATCLHAAAAGYGQVKITLSEKDAPVERIFNQIRKQTGYQFLYANQVLEQAHKVTIEVRNADLDAVLAACFKDQPFDYQVKEKTIVVRMRVAPPRLSASVVAPPVDVKGRVVNDKGEPVAGATVTVMGSKVSTVTNANGEFTLTGVGENATLLITHVNYNQQSLAVAGKAVVNAVMGEKENMLDETQVIAYGKVSKRLQTGNVTTVKASEIEKQPVNNPLLALQGRVPGLFISQTRGFAGGALNIRIQGQNSLRSGNEPLFIIDGVPYASQLLPTGLNGATMGSSGSTNTGTSAGNPFSYLNPADIESVEVLKDADATAIYGSRAANGAILITTKKGKLGPTKLDVSYRNGWGTVGKKLDLLNSEQYLEMRNEAKKNDNIAILATDYDINGTWDQARYTDWQKKLIGGTSTFNDAQATVSGGTTNLQYLVGAGYHHETTVFPGDFADNKGSLHFNINNVSSNQRLNLQLSSSYVVDDNRLPLNNDLTFQAMTLAPNAPMLYNEDGSVNWAQTSSGASTWLNPISYLNNQYRNKTTNLIGNLNVSYKLFPFLEIRNNFGYTSLQTKETGVTTLLSLPPEMRLTSTRTTNFANGDINSWIVEPQLISNVVLWRGKLNVLVGMTIQQSNTNGESLTGRGFNSDAVMEDIKSASIVTVNSSVSARYKYNALFGRVNYNFQNKYIFNVSIRRDGSSRFGAGSMFQNFGSFGAAWIFTGEKFFNESLAILSFGKLKASYGTTGNDQIGDYKYLNLYTPPSGVGVSYQGITSLSLTGLPNTDLQWEETRKFNVGIELGFFHDRLLLTANYAINSSSNQLVIYPLPANSGFQNILKNIDATVQNKVLEFTLNTKNFSTSDFSWSSSVNLSVPKNKLISFPGLENTGFANLYIINHPVSLIKAFNLSGVDPSNGQYQFYDNKGNLTYSPDYNRDRTTLINPDPKFYGGIQNSISYKNFEVDLLFQFVKQIGSNYIFGPSQPAGFFNTNVPVTLLSRWQAKNDYVQIQRYSSTFALYTSLFSAQSSNASYTDASFIRLKNLSLTYKLKTSVVKKMHLRNIGVFAQAQNLLTISNYKGLDPETMSAFTLPPLRVITLGVQVGI